MTGLLSRRLEMGKLGPGYGLDSDLYLKHSPD